MIGLITAVALLIAPQNPLIPITYFQFLRDCEKEYTYIDTNSWPIESLYIPSIYLYGKTKYLGCTELCHPLLYRKSVKYVESYESKKVNHEDTLVLYKYYVSGNIEKCKNAGKFIYEEWPYCVLKEKIDKPRSEYTAYYNISVVASSFFTTYRSMTVAIKRNSDAVSIYETLRFTRSKHEGWPIFDLRKYCTPNGEPTPDPFGDIPTHSTYPDN